MYPWHTTLIQDDIGTIGTIATIGMIGTPYLYITIKKYRECMYIALSCNKVQFRAEHGVRLYRCVLVYARAHWASPQVPRSPGPQTGRRSAAFPKRNVRSRDWAAGRVQRLLHYLTGHVYEDGTLYSGACILPDSAPLEMDMYLYLS
jgi:hypothetical protein